MLDVPEVFAVARAAASEQDGALFLTAAFTGLRQGELIALCWTDVDFAKAIARVVFSFSTHGRHGPTKGDTIRSVPMADPVAQALDGLSRREHFVGEDDLVSPTRQAGGFQNDGLLRKRFYKALDAAGLGHLREQDVPIRFHDLRHSFGTRAVQVWPISDVQAMMGHADIATTMVYVHYQPRVKEAAEFTALLAQEGAEQLAVVAPVVVK